MEKKLFGSEAGVVEVKKRKSGTEQAQTGRPSDPFDYLPKSDVKTVRYITL